MRLKGGHEEADVEDDGKRNCEKEPLLPIPATTCHRQVKRTNNRILDTCQIKSDRGRSLLLMVGLFMMDHTTSMADFSSKMMHTTSKKTLFILKRWQGWAVGGRSSQPAS